MYYFEAYEKWVYTLFSSINLHTNQHTGEHFNLPGHELYHLKVSVLEKVWELGRSLLDSKYIRDFMTEPRGMNRN